MAIYFYKKGKNTVTLQSLPGELPGNTASGNMSGASNDEIKNVVSELHQDLKGFNYLGHNQAVYERASILNDADLVKVYNAFNALYQKDYGQTLTEWLNSEIFLGESYNSARLLEKKLKKLNCL